jgi:hypothetical protein
MAPTILRDRMVFAATNALLYLLYPRFTAFFRIRIGH